MSRHRVQFLPRHGVQFSDCIGLQRSNNDGSVVDVVVFDADCVFSDGFAKFVASALVVEDSVLGGFSFDAVLRKNEGWHLGWSCSSRCIIATGRCLH